MGEHRPQPLTQNAQLQVVHLVDGIVRDLAAVPCERLVDFQLQLAHHRRIAHQLVQAVGQRRRGRIEAGRIEEERLRGTVVQRQGLVDTRGGVLELPVTVRTDLAAVAQLQQQLHEVLAHDLVLLAVFDGVRAQVDKVLADVRGVGVGFEEVKNAAESCTWNVVGCG